MRKIEYYNWIWSNEKRWNSQHWCPYIGQDTENQSLPDKTKEWLDQQFCSTCYSWQHIPINFLQVQIAFLPYPAFSRLNAFLAMSCKWMYTKNHFCNINTIWVIYTPSIYIWSYLLCKMWTAQHCMYKLLLSKSPQSFDSDCLCRNKIDLIPERPHYPFPGYLSSCCGGGVRLVIGVEQ